MDKDDKTNKDVLDVLDVFLSLRKYMEQYAENDNISVGKSSYNKHNEKGLYKNLYGKDEDDSDVDAK